MTRVLLAGTAAVVIGAAIVAVAATRSPRARIISAESVVSAESRGGAAQSLVPVLVELFTSEGCSSCPPADDVLTRLLMQPVANAVVIPLGEHVDYWDRLGWRDAFSSASFSTRQSEYDARTFHTGSIYTPQMVVDGRTQFVGSDYRRATQAISAAASQPKPPLDITVEGHLRVGAPASLHVGLEAPQGFSANTSVVVMLGVTEDGLTTDVQRGENGGHSLHHTAVVRSLIEVGTVQAGTRAWSTGATAPIAASWNPKHLRVVAFAQDLRSRAIIAAATRILGD